MSATRKLLQEDIASHRSSAAPADSAVNQASTWERRPPVALRPLPPSQHHLRPDVFLPPPPVSRAYQTSLPQISLAQRSSQQSPQSESFFGMLSTPQSLPRAAHEAQLQGRQMDLHESFHEKQAPSFNFSHYQPRDQLLPSPTQSPAPARRNDTPEAAPASSSPAVASTESESETHEEIRIPEDLPDLVDDGTKPPYSYAMLIGMAILRSPERRLTLSQIYSWINDTYSWYKSSTQAWQNSIRHNLSLSKAFQKQQRPKSAPGKGNYWVVVEGHEAQFAKPLAKRGHPPSPATKQTASQPTPQVASQLPAKSERQPAQTQHSATSSVSTTSSEESVEVVHAAKQRLPPLDQLTAEGSGSLSAAAYGHHSETLGVSPRRLFSTAREPNFYALSPGSSSYTRPAKRAKLGPRDPFVFKCSTDDSSLTSHELIMSPYQGFSSQAFSVTRLPPPVFSSGLTNDASMTSPRTSLRNHRAQIRSLTSTHDGPFLSARKDDIDDQENKFWGPSLAFGHPANYHSSTPFSPQSNQASGLREKLLYSAEHEYLRSKSPESHFEHDNLRRPLSDHCHQPGAQQQHSVFVTPLRHPFDTPIRDQQYAFSPMKGYPASGSPRR